MSVESGIHPAANQRSALDWIRWISPHTPEKRSALRLRFVRILIAANLVLGAYYLIWRFTSSINFAAWPFAFALIAAETYSYLDSWLFGLTMWRMRERKPLAPPEGAKVDVFITCYNEPVEIVRRTVQGAMKIRYPHQVFVLDDGNSAVMRAMAAEEGAGYIVRSSDWEGRPLHAKAGNLNNALLQTSGEFILALDADAIPYPQILDRTLGYFRDPKVAFVQTPQWFYNVPPGDPFGSQASLFYGPIMEGKDGWNAAFFCGSNAVLRREALMFIGVSRYVLELEQRLSKALKAADSTLRHAEYGLHAADAEARAALRELRSAADETGIQIKAGRPIQEATWAFQRRCRLISERLVSTDLETIQAELAGIPGVDASDLQATFEGLVENRTALERLSSRDASPLAAIVTVQNLLAAVDVGMEDEAQPVMPMARVSVTEDMATALRLHAAGWKSVFHNEILGRGLAPEDLGTAMKQRLRWAEGTIQVMLRENPLVVRGLTLGQRLMYWATMWSYLSGFFAIIFIAGPPLYLFFAVLPVRAYSVEFFWHLLPYLAVNQLLFTVVGFGRATWRGQQYSLALFPVWIRSVVNGVTTVCFGKTLKFAVTPKTRQSGSNIGLVLWQLLAMGILVIAVIWGLARLAFGLTGNGEAIIVNVLWAWYDLAALSVVLDAVTYRPIGEESALHDK